MKKNRIEINQWLMAQMGYVGPMLGQHHQFHHYNPGKSKFGEERYFKISKRIYQELDEVLSKSKFLSGNDYTIADIGTFPWIARHEWHDIGLKKYKNLTRWYVEISKRDAVKKGFSFMDKNEASTKTIINSLNLSNLNSDAKIPCPESSIARTIMIIRINFLFI